MDVYKTRSFAQWARKAGLPDASLAHAVRELVEGLVEADLGSGLFKKRVAAGGKGKRGAFRVLLAYRTNTVVYFLFGFEKSDRENINHRELTALRRLARHMLGYGTEALKRAIDNGELIEVLDEQNS